MEAFKNIIGNRDAKLYFTKAIREGHISHSYIFEGPYGVGKNTFSIELAKLLLCTSTQDNKPCEICDTCHMINTGNHPDVITIQKDTKVTKIENIRTNIVREMEIKPYSADYKLIIVEAADTITIEGQNAMLKTIEEPPNYGIIILICENSARLLPTIRSRCINVRFNPLTKEQMEHYLDSRGITGLDKKVYAKLSDGSIGTINDILENEQYLTLRKESIAYIIRLQAADMIEVYNIVKEITEQKEYIEQILELWLYWYRDIAVLKAANSQDLYNLDYQQQLLDMSNKLPYNKVSQNIEHLKKAILDIKCNIYSTFVIENLLLQLKERNK